MYETVQSFLITIKLRKGDRTMDGEGKETAVSQETVEQTSTTENTKPQEDTQQEAEQVKTYDDAYIAKLREEFEKQQNAAVEEALKKEKMSEEDKAKYEADKRLQDIEKREKEIALRELKADAAGMLAKEHLPNSFIDMVIGTDAQATQKNIKALKEAIHAEVQIHVEERLKGKAPKTGTGDSEGGISDMEAQINKIMGL